MSLSPDNNNPIPDLSFLKISLSSTDNSEEFGGQLIGTFDFRTVSSETRTCSYDVGFRTAWLTLEYEGFEPNLETRYGLQAYPLTTKIQQKTTTGLTKITEEAATISGGLAGAIPKGSAELNDKSAASESQAVEVTSEKSVCLIETHGDQSWCFTGQAGGPLRGNLVPSVPIVELNHASGNRKHIHAVITVKQRDLWYHLTDGIPLVSEKIDKYSPQWHTKKKLAAIVLAKALAKHAGTVNYAGSFKISESVLSDGADEGI